MSTHLQTGAPPAVEGGPSGPRRRQPTGGPKGSGADRAVGAASQGVLVLWTVLVIAPLLWTLMSSFKTTQEIFASPFSLPTSLHLENYVNAWTLAGIGRYFANSVVVVTCALVLTMVLGSMSAYVLARFPFPGRGAVRTLIVAGLTFPVFLAVVPLFFILQQAGLLNTLPGLVAAYTAYAYPFTVFFLVSFFEDLPHEVAEAASIDGAGEWRTFFQVMLPMARPGMAAVAILNFVGLWNQFLLPVVLNSDQDSYVLTQGMASFASQAGYAVDFGALFAGAVTTIVPVLVVYLVFQRRLQGSVSAGSVK
ncbi:carbohydrate ABC transporter permease [Pseudokineococcus lusitanus]|jgi:N-acetylglucosamine transport system permease protein|uniref:Carbohydrate ABC transporter membrane protein 2 (CUT1 family) n=1 Tax=Pseudokineococcus lusitanus TaxID=763993 RepID=A0A3N1GWA8_9ACTN|nr:carbohydrate ABC transporter permease [Pseudokineococcus lusitanus]ROP34525.1 carbohydrate ABC transporter membrane protein 2 (CUT1 family) [Pseudokineococcus lusitanus]